MGSKGWCQHLGHFRPGPVSPCSLRPPESGKRADIAGHSGASPQQLKCGEMCMAKVALTKYQKLGALEQQQKFIVSLLWRPEVWNVEVCRDMLSPEALGKALFQASLPVDCLSIWLTDSCLLPAPLHFVLPLSVSKFSLLIRAPSRIRREPTLTTSL